MHGKCGAAVRFHGSIEMVRVKVKIVRCGERKALSYFREGMRTEIRSRG